MSTQADNPYLKGQVAGVDNTYSDFLFINSHNLILSPKKKLIGESEEVNDQLMQAI